MNYTEYVLKINNSIYIVFIYSISSIVHGKGASFNNVILRYKGKKKSGLSVIRHSD